MVLLNSYLLNKNGSLYLNVEFVQMYNIPIKRKEYCIVFDAIPSGLKCLFKGNVNTESVSLRPDVAIKGFIIMLLLLLSLIVY